MPTPGKPVSNPFAPVDSMGHPASVRPGTVDKPGRPVTRKPRGISVVGTEDRLVRLPMNQATGLSLVLHVVSPVALTILTLLALLILSWIMNFNFGDLFKPKAPPQDMEFTLVQDTQATKPDKALFKGNYNQRAGGKQDSKQPLKAVEEPPKSSAASKPQITKEQSKVAAKPEQQQAPQPPQPKQPPVQKPKQEALKPLKPAFVPSIPTPSAAEKPDKPIGPVAKTQTASATAGTKGAKPQEASTGTSFTGSSSSTSDTHNPQKGDARNPGVDVEEEANFGPFMADLKRRIQRNWVPPRDSESRTVLLLFYLARDGRVIKVEITKSSGDDEQDRAAIAAIQASAPFSAFPPQVKEDILPIEYTFDYNVINHKNSKQALNW